MCRAVRCKTCGKTTWAGCGQHVASVKAGVPAGQWCPGHESRATTGDANRATTGQDAGGGFLSRLFGRG
ncbi:MAG TPA: hypothetical protein PKH97_10075 [Tetrasphaera sp.]|nr:hypothetical protein [Tetrasphaera sp.]